MLSGIEFISNSTSSSGNLVDESLAAGYNYLLICKGHINAVALTSEVGSKSDAIVIHRFGGDYTGKNVAPNPILF